MEDTSERIILTEKRKNEADYYIYLLHLASYHFATKFAEGMDVLDYGCGTGYGSQILSKFARSVTGTDISYEAIMFAQNNFERANIYYKKTGDNDSILPFNDNSFDLVTSFQVIEHLTSTNQHLREIVRVLRPGGLFLLTTPDRETRLFHFQNPWNYYHKIEYSSKHLNLLLSRYFKNTHILKIGGVKELTYQELRRRKYTKFVTLPFTLKIIPNRIRKFCLRTLKKAYYKNPRVLSENNKILKYTVKDIKIGFQIESHTDLFAICKKTTK